MRLTYGKLLLAIPALTVLMTGCAPTIRMVTATHWSNADTYYMAYAEKTGSDITPKVKKCKRETNNQLACADQEKINPLLTPESGHQ